MGQNGGHRAFSQLWLRKKKCAGTDRKYENDNKMEEISCYDCCLFFRIDIWVEHLLCYFNILFLTWTSMELFSGRFF